jgi:N-acetylmuramoyl-L-alanine amidase
VHNPRSSIRLRTRAGAFGAVVVVCAAALPAAHADPDLAGTTVFLDPGHGGRYDASMTRQVPTGRGGTKDCQTAGASTDSGYPEHTFNWDVVQQISTALTARGVRVQLSRSDDASLGPCVDQRAAAANALAPDAIVSIHADDGPAGGHGFHVNYSAPPLNDAQAAPAMQLADTMRDALVASGMVPSTYLGSNGLYGRSDLTGLNLAEYPAVLVELGNMKNPGDSDQMTDPAGRARYAAAVVQGITAYLGTHPHSAAQVH